MKLSNLRIKGYRGIKDLELPLNRINIIVGPNNTGKSAILEAVALISLKDNDFFDARNVNLLQHLVETKRYRLNYFVNVEMEKAIIESDGMHLEIEYFDKGLPESVTYQSIREYLENKLRRIIGLESGRLVEEVLHIFAKEMRLNDEQFQSLRTKVLEQLKLHKINKTIEDVISTLQQKRKLVLSSSDTLHFYLTSPITVKISEGLYLVRMVRRLQSFMPIVSKRTGDGESKVIFGFQRMGSAEAIYELYGELVRSGKINWAIELIKEQVPYVQDVRMTTHREIFVLTTLSSKAIPISSMGDGFISLVKIAFLTGFVENGLIILEEPEISLHPGFTDVVSRMIVSNPQNNQFILSTHSIDFLESVLNAAAQSGTLDAINIIRLHRREDIVDVFAEVLKGEEAFEEIEAIGTDLRIT